MIRSRVFWLYLFPILSGAFYYINILPLSITVGCLVTMPILLFVFTIRSIGKKSSNLLEMGIKFFGVVFCISIINSYLFYNQSFELSYRVMCMDLLIFYYFVLKQLMIKIDEIETAIKFHFVVYVICWGTAYVMAPTVLFGYKDFVPIYGNVYRILLNNSIYITLFFFISLSHIREDCTKYLPWVLFTLIMQLLTITRQAVFFTIFFGLMYYLFQNNTKTQIIRKAFIFISFFSCLIIVFAPYFVEFDMVSALQDRTERDFSGETEGGSLFSRLENINYFLFEHNYNIQTFLWGSGFPHWDSEFGKLYERLNDRFIYLSDVGYVYDFFVYGVCGLLLLVTMCLSQLKKNYQDRYSYIRYMFLYILCCNFMSSILCSNMLVIGLLMYMSVICKGKRCLSKTKSKFLILN